MEKRGWYARTELFVDRIIPYLIILLSAIIIIDIFYHDVAVRYGQTIVIIDGFILAIFCVDLIFKYRRVHNIPRFLRLYWLDIIAIFPFFIVFRLVEEAFLLSEQSALTLRNLLHAGLVIEEEALAGESVIATSEVLAKEGRAALVVERFAFLRRFPRMLKAFDFFETPKKKKR